MSLRSRVAFATGVAGLVGATLLLSGRFEGSVVLALLLATGARAAAAAALVDAGPIMAAGAVRSLRLQASFGFAWSLVLVAGVARAGSAALAAARGANSVAGIALARGPSLTVAGVWFAATAGAIALAARAPIGAETASGFGSAGRVVAPGALRRLEAGGLLAQAAVLVTMFAGPQVTTAIDGIWWAAGIVLLAAVAWRSRAIDPRRAAVVATVLAAIGAVLVITGGTP